MRAVYILAAVVLVLFLLGQVRVGGLAEFSAEGFRVWARLGGFKLQVVPWKWGGDKPSKPKKKKKKKPKKPKHQPAGSPQSSAPPGEGKEPPKPQKPPLQERLGGALEYAQALLPVVLRAVEGTWRGLRVDLLELELTAGAPDPGDAALRYGQANAALGAIWTPLTQALNVKDGFARVRMDFDAGGMTVYGKASLSIKIGTVVWVGLRAAVSGLFRFLAARKRLKQKRKQRKAA